MNFYKDCFVLMDMWNKTKDETVADAHSLCISFRDQYHLTDMQAIKIARGIMDPAEILKIGEQEK